MKIAPNYPNLPLGKENHLANLLEVANNPKEHIRQPVFIEFITTAMQIASDPSTIPDPSPEILAAWQGLYGNRNIPKPPGGNFRSFKVVLGNAFYYFHSPKVKNKKLKKN